MTPAAASFDLSDRTAVVTGAGSDIGAAIARGLAAAGARLVLGDRDEARLEAAARGARAAGSEVEALPTDVTRAADVDALVARAAAAGGPDLLVNLAAVIFDATVADTEEADLDALLAVNVKGTYLCCRAAARAMGERGGGGIVNMASSGAFVPLPGLAAYALSKAAVVSLTRSLAAELGPAGIRVNAVAPGYVEGGMSARGARRPDGSVDAARLEAIRERTRRSLPLRLLGTPEDVAQAVLFLASDAARIVTGQVLHVNGGRPMP